MSHMIRQFFVGRVSDSARIRAACLLTARGCANEVESICRRSFATASNRLLAVSEASTNVSISGNLSHVYRE